MSQKQKDFYEKDLQKMQATELVIKNKKFIINQMYQKGSFYMQNSGKAGKTFFISGSLCLGKSRHLQKIWQEELTHH